MNVLDRIVELRLERGWTEYQLSQQSGITQSTISAWYRKNTLPSIPSLQKICNAFNISMSEFFMEEDTTSVHLNETRFRLLRYAERLNGTQLSSMLKFLKIITICTWAVQNWTREHMFPSVCLVRHHRLPIQK